MNRLRIFNHLFFWLVWLVSMSMFYGFNPKNNLFFTLLLSLGISLPVYAGYTYFTVYIIVPRTLLNGKLLIFLLYILVMSFIVSSAERFHMNFFYFRYFSVNYYESREWFTLYGVLRNMVWVNVPLVMFASIKYIRGFSLEQSKRNELEAKNQHAELSLLMMQLRPHFLFNTLNNLYSLALAGSPKTRSGLEKILGMLAYILFEYNKDQVSIGEEIKLIENYIELEKIRYDERLAFSFRKEIQNPSFRIIPMVLFTFVENSFKHGSSPEAGKSFIDLYLYAGQDVLVFKTRNSIPVNKSSGVNSGLGLLNVQKRLDLGYPNRHKLRIDEGERYFSVSLTIYNEPGGSEF